MRSVKQRKKSKETALTFLLTRVEMHACGSMQIIYNLTSIFTLTIVMYCRSLFVDVKRTYAEVQRTSAQPTA